METAHATAGSELQVLAVLVVVGACVLFVLYQLAVDGQRRARVERAFREDLPARVGGVLEKRPLKLMDTSLSSPRWVVRFPHAGTTARLFLDAAERGSPSAARLVFDLTPPAPPSFTIAGTRSIKTSRLMLTHLWGEQRSRVVESGNRMFDERFVVYGSDEQGIRALLTTELQDALLHAVAQHQSLSVQVRDGSLTVSARPWPPTAEALHGFALAGRRVYDAIAASLMG